MNKEIRTVCYDEELKLEAYRLEGIVQPFPNHFHDYYVIGFVESGERVLSCKNKEYTIKSGNIILFHPGDNHACAQSDGGTLDYRGLNIPKETMQKLTEEITGKRQLPGFLENVILDEELNYYLRPLHQMILSGSKEFEKEEILLFLIGVLLEKYEQSFEKCTLEYYEEVENACTFMKENFAERIYLDQICQCAKLSKSTLLRAFTKAKGITPYRYLESIRISEAKKLLEKGISPIEASMRTGFSDQSHFTNFFSTFIGVTPGAYRDIFLEKENKEELGGKQDEK